MSSKNPELIFLVRPTWAYSNGCKSRACPDSGKRIVRSNGVDREENRKEAKDKSLAPRTET